MNWYYSDNGRQAGPVDDAGLDGLIRLGAVRAETLIWKEGMANWQPLSVVRPQAAPEPPAPAPAYVPPAPQPQPQQQQYQQPQYQQAQYQAPAPQQQQQQAPAGVTCANCGQSFPQSEVVFIGNSYVCGGCKPVYLQRMREGAAGATVGARRYASFGIRLAALLIDGIIVMIASWVVTLPLTFAITRVTDNPMVVVAVSMILNLVQIAAIACYQGYFLSTKGATPGKSILNLQVIRSDGSRLSFARGACRYLAQIVSTLILFIGYIIAAFDSEHRTLHDHICDTRVVVK